MNHKLNLSYYKCMQQYSGGGSMKLERISQNQIKYSISFEELSYKGLIEEEMTKDTFLWDELYDEMLDEANKMYKLEMSDAVSIDIYSLTSQELILILTLEDDELIDHDESEEIFNSLRSGQMVIKFDQLEDCIQLTKRLIQTTIEVKSSMYFFQSQYCLILNLENGNAESLIALAQEYGNISSITDVYIQEYGKQIIPMNAIQLMDQYFD